jgi:ketosteroid isomerase-like protein
VSTSNLKEKTQQFMEKIFSDTENAIKETAAANVVVNNNQPENVPLKSKYEGHDGLSQCFADLSEKIDMSPIEYGDLYADGSTVIGLGVEKGVVRTTGKSYEMPFVHVFRYNDAGQLAELTVFNNTLRLAAAFE